MEKLTASKHSQKKDSNTPLPEDSIVDVTNLFGNEESIDKVFKPFVKTGIKKLDEMLGGGFSPGFAVLGAISNLGKSTFALQLAANIVKQGTPVMFFSLEMPAEWVAAKLISQRTFINDPKNAVMAKELVNREVVKSDDFKKKWTAVSAAVQEISNELKDLYIIDAKSSKYKKESMTAEEIKNRVEEFIQKHNKKPFVIIDYLQIIPVKNAVKASSEMYSIDHNISVLSKIDKDITVLMISSLNRESYSKTMSLGAFKGSGTIEYSADVILGLDFSDPFQSSSKESFETFLNRQKSKNPRKVQVTALKQRYNASGKDAVVKFGYWSAYDYFDPDYNETEKNGTDEDTTSKKADPGTINFFMYCETKNDVKIMYKKLSKMYHPDELHGNLANDFLFKIIDDQYKKKMEQFR